MNTCTKAMRLESDSIGTKELPVDVYYGVQSLRALENFPITGTRLHPEMIRSLALLKEACAIANKGAGVLDAKIADAIFETAAGADAVVEFSVARSMLRCIVGCRQVFGIFLLIQQKRYFRT